VIHKIPHNTLSALPLLLLWLALYRRLCFLQAMLDVSIYSWGLGAITFLFCYLAHVLVWRLFRSLQILPALFTIFLVLPAGAFLTLAVQGTDILIPVITHYIFSFHYISFYPAFSASSPTIVILDSLARSPDGLSYDQIAKLFDQKNVLEDRFDDLKTGRLITVKENRLENTPLGNLIAGFFIFYRKFIGLTTRTG